LGADELDAVRRHGCLFMLTCHPFLSGRPGRIEALRLLIEAALERGDVRFEAADTVTRRAMDCPSTPRRKLEPVEVEASDFPVW
jgi:peptidoglycan-N-acetylglucosamine deacetylase